MEINALTILVLLMNVGIIFMFFEILEESFKKNRRACNVSTASFIIFLMIFAIFKPLEAFYFFWLCAALYYMGIVGINLYAEKTRSKEESTVLLVVLFLTASWFAFPGIISMNLEKAKH